MDITLLLAMRNEAFIWVFSHFVETTVGAKVVAACRRPDEVESSYFSIRPSMLLIDIKSGSAWDIHIVKAIIDKDPFAKVIGITANFHEEVKAALQGLGGKGYLLRNDSTAVMQEMILRVANGHTMFTV